jgi:ring-1,2-phenylacetyl-CoA epoxidase subunit PaaC
MTNQEALYQYLLRLGDNGLIQGHRLSEWCSKGPILEEDLAMTNLALDNIGRAQAFLKYAGEAEGKGKTEDDLAYKRGEREFYNHLITELPIGDFAYTVKLSKNSPTLPTF